MSIRRSAAAGCVVLTVSLAGCGLVDEDTEYVTVTEEVEVEVEVPVEVPATGTIAPVVNVATNLANDLRGLSFAADGRIYASGHVGTDAALLQSVVARFNADGTLDTTFGGDGVVEIDVAVGREEQSYAVVELANGDVVAAVNAVDADGGESVYLIRLDSDGNQLVMPEWGDASGLVEVAFGWANADNGSYPGVSPPADTAWDLQLDGSGGGERLVVFGFGSAGDGTRTDNDRYIVRLDAADGSVDPAFNGGAPFTHNSGGTFGDNQRRGIVEADGSILAAGYTNFGGDMRHHVILIRLTAAGEPDPTFGNVVSPAETETAAGIAPQAGVAVFNPFRVDGGYAECYAVARQSTGSYVTTGYGGATGDATTSTLGYATTLAQDLVSFRGRGTGATFVDSSWANTGTQAVQSEGRGRPTNEDRGRQIVVLPDDRTLHVGRFGGIAAVAVLTADGALDTTEGGDGIIELGHPSIDSQFFNAVLSADGSQVALTTNSNDNGARLVVLAIEP